MPHGTSLLESYVETISPDQYRMPILSAFPTLPPARSSARAVARLFIFGLTLATVALPARAGDLEDASQSLKAGQHAKALEQVNRHLSAKPKDAQGRFLKGIILTGQNKLGDAITVFKKLTEDYPELPEPYNNLAVIYAQQKQYDKAKEALEMAIRTHPAYATAHENLGDIYSRLASQAYGKALQIDSSNASAQTKLAMINELVGGKSAPAGVASAATKPVEAPKPVVLAEAKPVENKAAEAKPLPPPAPKPEAKPETKPEAKPEPVAEPKAKAEPAKAKSANAETEIAEMVDGWLSAWSKKDVKGYLGHYARDFDTPGNAPRKDWEADRSKKVGKPGKIEVSRGKLTVKADGDGKATASFRQSYVSASFKASSNKTLHLVKRDGKWQIQQELVD